MFKALWKARKSMKGFSLVELMVVVAIIAVLSAVAIPMYNRYRAKARQTSAADQIKGWAAAWNAALTNEESAFAYKGVKFTRDTGGMAIDMSDCAGDGTDTDCFATDTFSDATGQQSCKYVIQGQLDSRDEGQFHVDVVVGAGGADVRTCTKYTGGDGAADDAAALTAFSKKLGFLAKGVALLTF